MRPARRRHPQDLEQDVPQRAAGRPRAPAGTGVAVHRPEGVAGGGADRDRFIGLNLSWIDADPANGILSVVFYDNRNSGGTQTEAWTAVSYDAGDTWEDFKVSDVSFVPAPIPGMAGGYMGDYLAIRALNGWVYPCWTDNRTGFCRTYVSPFQTVQVFPPFGLQAVVDQETGNCELTWSHEQNSGFEHFNIYS